MRNIMVHDEATVAWGGSGDGAGRPGQRVRSSLPVQRCLLLIVVRCARAEVGWGRDSSRLVLGGTSVGGWSCGSGVVGDAAGVGLEVGLG